MRRSGRSMPRLSPRKPRQGPRRKARRCRTRGLRRLRGDQPASSPDRHSPECDHRRGAAPDPSATSDRSRTGARSLVMAASFRSPAYRRRPVRAPASVASEVSWRG
jgi:hypothetical protein